MDPTQQICFSEKASNSISTLIINGLSFPKHGRFDPLGKMWASVRKFIYKKSGIDSTGLFTYDDEQELITCNFYLNYGVLDGASKEEKVDARTRFETCFYEQARIFENVILGFVKAKENGYDAYLKLVTENDYSPEIAKKVDEIIDEYLISIGMKKRKKSKKSNKPDTPPWDKKMKS